MSGRPTWVAAQAQGSYHKYQAASKQYSSRDLPGHKQLKQRQPGQDTKDEVAQRDLKAELEAAERKAREEREGKKEQVAADTIPRLELRPDEARLLGLKRKAPTEIPPPPPSAALDADDASSEEEETSSSSSSGDDDDEDEEAALERELEKIRKEREEEKARREALEKQRRDAQALSSNPLIQLPGQQPPVDFVIKKKWYEDTVFRNQARGEPDNKKKRFINDTTRNDFHRKFLDKFIL